MINSISAYKNPTKYEQVLIRGAGLLKQHKYPGPEMAKRANIEDVIQVLASEGATSISQANSKFDVLI